MPLLSLSCPQIQHFNGFHLNSQVILCQPCVATSPATFSANPCNADDYVASFAVVGVMLRGPQEACLTDDHGSPSMEHARTTLASRKQESSYPRLPGDRCMKRGEHALRIPSLAQSHVASVNDPDVLHRPSHSYGGSSSSSQNFPILELIKPFLSCSLTGHVLSTETQLHIARSLRPLLGSDLSRYLCRTIRYDESIHLRQATRAFLCG